MTDDGVPVRIGLQGRVVIPASLRRELDLHPGDTVIVRVEDGRLILESRRAILDRIRRRFSVVSPGVSLVDELIAERREESKRENESE